MNDTKVVIHHFFNDDGVMTGWVTHDDYRVIEEDNLRLTAALEELRGMVTRLRFELARAMK